MERDIVDYALDYARSRKVEYVEARAQSTNHDELVIKNGTLDAFLSTINSGFCIKILADGGLGFASTNKWTKDEAKAVADTAYKFAKSAGRKEKITFTDEKGVETKWSVEQKEKIEDIPPEKKIDELMKVDKTLSSSEVKVPGRIIGTSIDLIEKYFVNSEGSAISSFVPKIGVFAFITVVENGKPEQAYKQFGRSGGWEAFDEWKVAETLLHDAQVLQKLIKEGKAVKAGKMDLICGTEVTGIASHESCGHPIEADRILGREMSQAGRSFIYPEGPYWIGT
ncbi:MAG: TldD/PmbA family protein, partial [Candidatus Bathyarchaeota archaeon]